MTRIVFLDSWRTEHCEGSGTAVSIERLRRGLQMAGCEVQTLRPELSGGTLLWRRLLYNLALPGRLAALKPDLVVGFDIDGFLIRNSPGFPYAVSLKGVLGDESRFEEGWDRIKLRLLSSFEKCNVGKAKRVIVPSCYSRSVARSVYGIPARKLRVVFEAIDLKEWTRHSTAGRSREPLTILNVARQYPRKNTSLMLRAMPELIKEHPELRLRIVGGGPELKNLRLQSRQLGIAGNVEFLESVPSDETVRRLYQTSHLFCLPSLQEGFGIVFLEAMAAGLPIVASQAGAIAEVVPSQKAGCLVPPTSLNELETALQGLLSDPQRRLQMGEFGRRHVKRFDLLRVARDFLKAVELE